MTRYQVTATRTTVYEVDANSEDDAIDKVICDCATEVDGSTDNIHAVPMSPEADALAPLDPRD